MKVAVIAPLGYSPPVVTEFLQYLHNYGIRVSDLDLLVTEDERVLQGSELVKIAVKKHYPWLYVHIHKLPFNDIKSTEDSLEFMKIASRIIRDSKERHKADRVYLCVAGGRKDMCIILSLLGQLFQINGVYHLIMQDVNVVNQLLERLRKEIEDLYGSDDKESYYKEHEREFDQLMFPHPSLYSVINIPVLPYPDDLLEEIMEVLNSKRPLGELSLPKDVVSKLRASGLIKVGSRYTYPTNEGMALYESLKGGVG